MIAARPYVRERDRVGEIYVYQSLDSICTSVRALLIIHISNYAVNMCACVWCVNICACIILNTILFVMHTKSAN